GGDARRSPDPEILKAAKGEQLVLSQRTSQSKAGLVALQLVLLPREEVAGIELGIADKPETVPVNAVAAGLGHHIHRASGTIAGVQSLVAGLDRKLLHRVGEWKRKVVVVQVVHVLAAIERETDIVVPRPVNGERLGSPGPVVAANDIAGVVSVAGDAGGEQCQISRIPAVERQLDDAALVDG